MCAGCVWSVSWRTYYGARTHILVVLSGIGVGGGWWVVVWWVVGWGNGKVN